MGKYYKAENVQTLINSLKCYGIPEINLDGLPTIEVSEDCISREWILEEFEKGRKTISKSEYFDELVWLVIHAPSVVSTTDENKCHRHGIRLEDGTPVYECIGCDEQDCKRKG